LLSYFEAPASRSPMAIACFGFLTLRNRWLAYLVGDRKVQLDSIAVALAV